MFIANCYNCRAPAERNVLCLFTLHAAPHGAEWIRVAEL